MYFQFVRKRACDLHQNTKGQCEALTFCPVTVNCGLNLSNYAREAELAPRSLQYHKAKSGTQINEKPLFCFMVPGTGLEPVRL